MFESALRDLLASQITALEEGLVVLNAEAYIPSRIGTRSFIDILAKDVRGRWVLIELKRSDAASREAIHEIYKYVEAVKGHLGARDDEIRAIIVSTEWKELLVPFSRFVHDTSISVSGVKISVNEPDRAITKESVQPLELTSGRVLSPWHEISLYTSEERLAEGIASYDASCKAKGINDYIMVELKAPEGFYESSVVATAAQLHGIRGDTGELTEEEIADVAGKMDRLDHMIYFVPQLQTAEEYLEMIRADPEQYEEAKEFPDHMEGDELLCSLQEYALDASPKVDRDYFEIGYPAKFRSKLLADEAWSITKIHRRGAFARNAVLTDETILGEIEGDAGTSGQRLKRTIKLSDRAEYGQLLKDVNETLPNNPVWAGMVRAQLEEARTDFPDGTAETSIFAPSTGLMTLFFAKTQESGINYVPSYTILIRNDADVCRAYVGELLAADDAVQPPEAFLDILMNYYSGDLGSLVMSMTWGGYEARDIDMLEELGLIYGSFRCNIEGEEREFSRMKNNRWRSVGQIVPYAEFGNYLEKNERLLRIIVNKLSPRIGGGICDGSSADRQLEDLIDPVTVAKGRHHPDAPEHCDICSIPLARETFFSDGRLQDNPAWANMCADCSVYHGAGIGWGTGQLYRKESDGRWLMVGGLSDEEGDENV
ncbi:endonuclease NucS domain-containing protein [Xanthobacter sp. VTT E-85241]|uniref:endonuclease NucS domain-containing protein n=1 Tax=Roseixanthobacter finlandensis TaxID=3119922 RepID=UPI00372A6B44